MTKKTKFIIAAVAVVAIGAAAATAAAKSKNKATMVRIEAVESRDLVSSVTS